MDAVFLSSQVRHIVEKLEHPKRFARRVLVIDPFQGPFLRQYREGDWPRLLREAEALRVSGWLDCVLIGPSDTNSISSINKRWFNQPSPHSHCIRNIRTAPQLFAFEQVATRYAMVCDVDVLIGRRNYGHDYLAEMLTAIQTSDVTGVSLNIPHAPDSGCRPYDAPPGEFAPEVRCGLLDLERVFACRPLPNSLKDDRLTLAWHRSLQQLQRQTGLRTLRGGSPDSFFVHPPNEWKRDEQQLDVIRDLVAQGKVPAVQFDQWDLVGQPSDWRYEPRRESIVFVVKGRNTAPAKIIRCLRSLAMQDDQDFGIVLMDDASDNGNAAVLPHLLQPFAGRCTLVCRSRRHGYMPNTLLAVRDIISSPDALAAVLDLDDALLHHSVVRRLKQTVEEGADVVLAATFKPDKPLMLYHPDFTMPRNWGSDVWIHLRSFRKRLFDRLPLDVLQLDGEWIEMCEDYGIMIPLVEMADRPTYLSEYLYFHERSRPVTSELRAANDGIIRRILAKAARRKFEGESKHG